MARRPDELALLALIEQPLESEGAAARLSALDRDVQVEVEQMRRNRDLLAGLAEPALPCDFVAGLASMMEPPAPLVPGIGRRGSMHRMLSDWMGTRSFGRAAAGLSLAACGGAALATVVWITLGRGEPRPSPSTDGGATALTSAMDAPSGVSSTKETRIYAAGDEVHHPPPGDIGHGAMLAGASGGPHRSSDPSAPPPVTVDLSNGAVALVIRADKAAFGVDALRRAVEASSPKDAALVRNVTYSEAGELEMRVRASARPSGESPPAMASADPPASRSSGQRPHVVVDPTLADATLGEHLAGTRSAAAAPELQLALSDDGFTHSVTIPVERLRELVMALAFDETVRMQLGRRETMAPDRLGALRAPARTAWQRWKDAAAMLDELERSVPRGTPVVVAARVQDGRAGGREGRED